MQPEAKTILLIEDDYYVSDLYKIILEHVGYKVVTAYNGLQGLQLAHSKPSLILLDIMLPYINGLELLKKLKFDPDTAKIPVVLITNLGQSGIIALAYEYGAQGYFLKVHLKPQELVDEVNKFFVKKDYKMEFNRLRLDD